MKDTRIFIRVSSEEKEEIRRIAQLQGLSMSELIIKCVLNK